MRTGRVLSFALLACMWLVCAEVVAYFTGGLLQARWLMYRDPRVPEANLVDGLSYPEYLAQRDPTLGWPLLSEHGTSAFEPNGSVPSPANAELGHATPAISTYGDSFTFARNAGTENGWDVRLSRRLRRRVDNFGVSGYGTAQAFMRFLGNADDPAEIVILGHMSENISRNLTRYRDFQNGEQWFAFKPRFAIDSAGAFIRVPIPELDPEDYQRFLGRAEPQLVLEHENFHPGGPAGAVRLGFPYSYALVRNFHYWRFAHAVQKARTRVPEPAYRQFYAPDHPFRGLQVTHGILEGFADEARRRGQWPLILLFPSKESTEYFQVTGTWSYQPLIDLLEADGVEFIDFGQALVARIQDRPLEEAYVKHHFTAEFHDLLAAEVHAHLERSERPARGE